MRANVLVRCHFGARTFLRTLFLKDLPPAQLCEGNVSCTVDVVCDWKQRFSSAALTNREVSSSGWVVGSHHCKVVFASSLWYRAPGPHPAH